MLLADGTANDVHQFVMNKENLEEKILGQVQQKNKDLHVHFNILYYISIHIYSISIV